MSVGDTNRHSWRAVQAADITAAYQSAVAAAGRGVGYKPFTCLEDAVVGMCWCTLPSVWHALLSLMRSATHLRSLSRFSSDDPLVVSALGYLPSLNSLHAECRSPASLVTFMEQRVEQTGRYRYLLSPAT